MKADWGTGAWLRGTPGPEIIKELTPQPGDVVVEGKKTLDAFHSTALDYYLRAMRLSMWCLPDFTRTGVSNHPPVRPMIKATV